VCRREEVRLEAQEADNIQLSQGLLRACAAERSLFCADVQPGSARVFRCLAHNLASADFGRGCMNAMMVKLRRRQANWRLDPPLRKACTADVER
jgi:Golgi apparatus protein 1